MAELLLIKMTNKTQQMLENVDILIASSTEKVKYDLLMPGDDYNDLASTFEGGFCDKICINADNIAQNAAECLLLKTSQKPDATTLVPIPNPYQRRKGYAEINVGVHIKRDCSLKIEKLFPLSIIYIAILFE